MLPTDILPIVHRWKQECVCEEKYQAAALEKICKEAEAVLSSYSDHTNDKILFSALKGFEFTDTQRQRIYSALERTPVSHAQTKMLDEFDINYEEFSDKYTLLLKDDKIVVSKAVLRTLGGFFNQLLQSGMSETKSKCIQLSTLDVQEFKFLKDYVSDDLAQYELEDPETWLEIKNIIK